MEHSDRPCAPFCGQNPGEGEAPNMPAEAAEIAARIAADQAAADEARLRFRRDGLPTLRPDECIAPLLARGERLVALRHEAVLDRREPAPGLRATGGVVGELYITSSRLLLVGRATLFIDLEMIAEAILSGERLLLVLRDGHGVMLQVAQPRLLWVEIAAARTADRCLQTEVSGVDPGRAAR